MKNKIIKSNKISPFPRKLILLGVILSVLLLNPITSYAQYNPQPGTFTGYGYGASTWSPSGSSNNQSNVTTNPASNITTSSATLNGTVQVTSNLYINVWFEYGTSTNFGYSTPRSSYGNGYSGYDYNISGLKPNTMYYFRTVTQNPSGIQYGNVETFTTDFLNINEAATASPVVSTATISGSSGSNKNTQSDNKKTSDAKDTATLASLGANAFGAGSFFPTNIFGWLILLIFTLIIILLSKLLYLKFLDKK